MASTRPRSLTQPFSAYLYRDLPPPDPVLTQVGPGTPCGWSLEFWRLISMKGRFLPINKLPLEEAVLLEPPEVSQPKEALFLRSFNPFGSLNDGPGKQFQREDNCVPSHL